MEDNELFIFDDGVKPILSVLCGKTLEQARMEVLEEEELRVMRDQQKHFEDVRNAEAIESQRMEQAEQRKRQEFERKKVNEREKKKNRMVAHKKLVARVISKRYIVGMKDFAFKHLADVSFFTNDYRNEVIEQNVLPWLQSKVEEFVKETSQMNEFPDAFLGDYMIDFEKQHTATVETEH